MLVKYTKRQSLEEKKCRPATTLSLVSKVYKTVIYKQASNNSERFFNEILCRFRKVHSAQHALFKFLASRQKALEK